jgi:hypothetical protein
MHFLTQTFETSEVSGVCSLGVGTSFHLGPAGTHHCHFLEKDMFLYTLKELSDYHALQEDVYRSRLTSGLPRCLWAASNAQPWLMINGIMAKTTPYVMAYDS